jgi:hypothetical protein
MDIAFKTGYSLVVAILFVLVVILGVRTFYDEPDYPVYPVYQGGPPYSEKGIYCDPPPRDACYIQGVEITPERQATLSDAEKSYLEDQREFAERQRDFENERKDYFRNVFIVATALGVAAIGAALFLFFRRVEAMPLGLLLGGVGVVIYGWIESARGPDEAVGTAPLFAVVAVGFVAVLAAGYWFLGKREAPRDSGG